MRQKLIINDLHIGVSRVAGSTPQLAFDLRMHLLAQVRALMLEHAGKDKDIIINGDLFDEFDIPMGDALAFYEIACEWLYQTSDPSYIDWSKGSELIIGRGNHDVSKDSSRLSMFDFVGSILAKQFPDRVRVITEPTQIEPGLYMIPHAVNQDVFEMQLKAALDIAEPSYILLHANYDNIHAAGKSDHSLNVSPEIAQALIDRGHLLIFGHEHQQKVALGGGVLITGSQFPTSVADCLNNESKHALVIDPAKAFPPDPRHFTGLDDVETWRAAGSFLRVDWRHLIEDPDTTPEGEFIRVEGECRAEEAAAMVAAVSKLRQKSSAFVVTNSVKVEGIEPGGEIEQAGEELTGDDVLKYLFDELDEAQAAAVKKLLEERE